MMIRSSPPKKNNRNKTDLCLEGWGVGDTHFSGSHIGEDTHITSDMCTGIHISHSLRERANEERPFPRPLHSLARSRETRLARPNRRACSQATFHGDTHITVKMVQIKIRAACRAQSDGLCYM